MNKSLVKVREDDVIKIFQGIPFRKSLGQAAAFTKQTGYESGLLVVRDLYSSSYYVSRMRKGTTDGFKAEDIIYDGSFNFDFGEQNVSFDRCYRFLDLHFHPEITECPEPSCPDLQLAQEDTNPQNECGDVDVRPIVGVAHILEDDMVITLLYQKRVESNIEIEKAPTLVKIGDDLSTVDIPDSSYIVDCLEKSKLFYADMLTLEKKHAYRPNDEDCNKLRRFVHTPRRRATTENSLHQPVYMELYSDEA